VSSWQGETSLRARQRFSWPSVLFRPFCGFSGVTVENTFLSVGDDALSQQQVVFQPFLLSASKAGKTPQGASIR